MSKERIREIVIKVQAKQLTLIEILKVEPLQQREGAIENGENKQRKA